MRTSVAFASLLLLLLATTAHGIRLDTQLQGAINKKQKMVHPTTPGEASVARSANKHCSPDDDGHCSSSGGTTKIPLTHAEFGATKRMQSSMGNGHTMTAVDDVADDDTTSTTPQQGRHEAEAPSHYGSDHREQDEATPRVAPWQQREAYPDVMDIAGMDYSPATRRSPIHN